jgi:hypothetical protein
MPVRELELYMRRPRDVLGKILKDSPGRKSWTSDLSATANELTSGLEMNVQHFEKAFNPSHIPKELSPRNPLPCNEFISA